MRLPFFLGVASNFLCRRGHGAQTSHIQPRTINNFVSCLCRQFSPIRFSWKSGNIRSALSNLRLPVRKSSALARCTTVLSPRASSRRQNDDPTWFCGCKLGAGTGEKPCAMQDVVELQVRGTGGPSRMPDAMILAAGKLRGIPGAESAREELRIPVSYRDRIKSCSAWNGDSAHLTAARSGCGQWQAPQAAVQYRCSSLLCSQNPCRVSVALTGRVCGELSSGVRRFTERACSRYVRRLAPGERVLEYKGEVTTWRAAARRHQRHGIDGHTFFFGLSNGYVIDDSLGGNSARWLNHACAANCEAVEEAGRVFIETIDHIEAGEELFIEYQLAVDDPLDELVRKQYACRCGVMICRQPMLAAAG